MFGAITQLTRERCSLCPVNCIDSDTRKPILSCVHNECAQRSELGPATSSSQWIAIIGRAQVSSTSSGNGHLEIETSVISPSLSLSRVGDVPWGSLAAQEKEIDTRGEFQRLRCVELELIARLPLDRGIRGRR